MHNRNKIKILFVALLNFKRNTGTPIRAKITIKEICRRFESVSVVCIKGMYLEELNNKNLDIIALTPFNIFKFPPFNIIFLSIQLFWILLQKKPNIIHTFNIYGIFPIFIYKMFFNNVKIILELHGMIKYELLNSNLLFKLWQLFLIFLEKIAIRFSDTIISMSYSQKRFLLNAFRIKSNKVSVSWAPVEVEIFPYIKPFKKDKFIVGYIGNDSIWQGLENIIKAAEILKGYSDIQFWLAGFYGEKYKSINSKNIVFHGIIERNKLAEKLSQCDIFLSPRVICETTKLQYPFKLSLYLALGRPVIATSTSDEKIIIYKAKCGKIIESNDPQTLAKSILEFKNLDYSILLEMGRNGRIFAEKYLTIEKLGEFLKKLYLK